MDAPETPSLSSEHVEVTKARKTKAKKGVKTESKTKVEDEQDERKLAASESAKRKRDDGIYINEYRPRRLVPTIRTTKKKARNGKEEASPPVAEQAAKAEAKAEVDHDSENDGDVESESDGNNAFDMLDEDMKAWISALGLEKNAGAKEGGLDLIDKGSSYTAPPSFEAVFKLTDYLFPVEQGKQTFHSRLFSLEGVKSTATGLPIRRKLRAIKKKNPNDPRVCYHTRKAKWIPPTTEALIGIVHIILETGKKAGIVAA